MIASLILMVAGLVYGVYASVRAYRESGEAWMLIFPTWIDPKCGVSAKIRRHGHVAFLLLLLGVSLYLIGGI